MPTFKYKTNVRGKVSSGEIDADDEQGAIAKLRQKNIKVTKVKKKSEIVIFGPKIYKITE